MFRYYYKSSNPFELFVYLAWDKVQFYSLACGCLDCPACFSTEAVCFPMHCLGSSVKIQWLFNVGSFAWLYNPYILTLFPYHNLLIASVTGCGAHCLSSSICCTVFTVFLLLHYFPSPLSPTTLFSSFSTSSIFHLPRLPPSPFFLSPLLHSLLGPTPFHTLLSPTLYI